MARELHADIALDVAPGTVVSIVEFATGLPATLYADEAGTPLTAVVVQPGGEFSVWLDEGRYIATVPGAGSQPFTVLTKSGLEGPAGLPGPTGATGPPGPTGPEGPSGTAAGGYQVGDLRFTALPTASLPAGWLLADGSAVSRTGGTKALFEAIGTAYGVGNGTTTFNLPDYRGRVAMGLGKGEGGDESETFPTRSLGAKIGGLVRKLTLGQMPEHAHQQRLGTGSGSKSAPYPIAAVAEANANNTTKAGASEPHDNVQPSTVCSVWIKT